MTTQDEMRTRFHKLGAQEATIRAKSAPLRTKRDALANDARAKEDKFNAEIRAVETGLFDICQERAFIVRALKGETGLNG